jgi:hypothetical protein
MLAVNEIIGKAKIYLNEVVPQFASLQPNIEEMVLVDGESQWRITFQASPARKQAAESIADLVQRQTVEKVVEIGADDGSLIAVRNPYPF